MLNQASRERGGELQPARPDALGRIGQTIVAPAAGGTHRLIAETRPSIWGRSALMALVFLLATSVPTARMVRQLNVPGHPELPYYGLQDFRDAFYYPSVSLLDGHNPYNEADYVRRYPVGDDFPLYSPISLAVHLPFALLGIRAAEALFYLLNVALTLVLAALSFRLAGAQATAARVFALGALVMLSRPGHMNLFTGQCTVYVVIGVYVALRFARSRPWLAAGGLALSYLKPTYGVPLALLMLCRRDVRAVLLGTGVGGLVSAAMLPFLVRAAGGVGPLLDSLLKNYLTFGGKPSVDSIYRIDAVWFFGHLLGSSPEGGADVGITLGILWLGGLAVWLLAQRSHDASRVVSSSLICVTILTCVYHQAYDALILTFPLVAVVGWRGAPAISRLGPAMRAILVCLFAVPALNYLVSDGGMRLLVGRDPWWFVVTSLNGGAVLAAFLLYLGAAMRAAEAPASRPAHVKT